MADESGIADLREIGALIVQLQSLGATVSGVEMLAYHRKEAGKTNITNKQILNWLAEGGRDFQTFTPEDNKKIRDAFTTEVQRKTERFGKKEIKSLKNAFNSILVSGLKKALLMMIQIIRERIEQGKTATGGVDPLSDDYAKRKKKKHGFTDPIGVATSQLLSNLQGDVKNIKVVK